MAEKYVNYRLDGEANPLYWGLYRTMYKRVKPSLTSPGMRINQGLADRVGFAIGVLSLNVLEWTHFDFTKSDNGEHIYGLPTGKSAHIDFTRSLGLETSEIDMNIVVNAIVARRHARANDHLYLAHVSGIEYAGWQVRWCPREQNPLHLLLIPNKLFDDQTLKVTKNEKVKLTKAFWKVV